MLVNRLAGLVLPTTSKFLIDDVIGRGRADLLIPLASAAAAATLVDAATGFALSQVLGVAAQKAIANMRMSMQRHITRLPTSYFDSTQTGVLISRVMNDADGIRNLVGSGLVQLVGGLVTAVIALAVLFYLNWQLTLMSIVVLVAVRRRDDCRVRQAASALPRARQDHRPDFGPARRIVRRHQGRQGLHCRGARGPGVRDRRPQPVCQRSPDPHWYFRRHVVRRRRHRHDWGRHDGRRWPGHSCRYHDARRFHHVHLLRRHAGGAAHPDVVDRHAAVGGAGRARSHPRDQGDGDRRRRRCLTRASWCPQRRRRVRRCVVRIRRRACPC